LVFEIYLSKNNEFDPFTLQVGADGVQSKVRQVAGINTIGWDHGQAAVVATVCMGELFITVPIVIQLEQAYYHQLKDNNILNKSCKRFVLLNEGYTWNF
uniref:FAD_binding_3 domain-containing protein n=1 Tax=Echinostoma caproni TaxID=27848 RepID=A0A183BEC7_9TREM